MVKHFKNGSTCPEIKKEALTFYLMRYCPFSMRVNLVLTYHKIPHDKIYIDITSKPDWYVQRNPSGKVPFIEQEGQKMGDSEMVCAYLDQLNPDSSLNNDGDSDPKMAAVKSFWSKSFKGIHAILFEKEVTSEHINATMEGLKDLNAAIEGPYLNGDSLRLSDLMLYPIIDRLEAIFKFLDQPMPSGDGEYCKLMQYRDVMQQLDCVKEVSMPTDLHYRYGLSLKAGNMDCDFE